jgi:hypothetical protein
MKRDSYPCPSCGFLVFSEPPGSYAICQFCGWEDDHVQLAHPAMRGGANGESLAESQIAILRDLPLEVREHKGVLRDPQWRPLRSEELEVAPDAPRDGISYFHAACSEEPIYYWLRDENK